MARFQSDNRLQRWLVLVFLIVAGFFGSLTELAARAQEPIRLAMITAKTGKAGKTNIVSFPAARFAVDKINSTGGILGRKVMLLEYDNKSTPEGSAEAARQAISDGVVAVVGCNWSSHSLSMAMVLQQAGVPMISHMSTNQAVTLVGDYIFRTCFTDSFQGLGLARFARIRLKDRTAVILVDENRAYSLGLADSFTEAFKGLGGRILWRGVYAGDDIPYDDLLEQVAEYAPDALFVPGGYTDVAGFFGRAREMNAPWDLLSSDGIGVRLYELIGNKADGVYYSGHWNRWVDTEISRRFVKEYEQAVGPVSEDTMALVYDSFMVLRDAFRRAGTTDGAAVRDALAATPGYEGVTGIIRFDGNGDPIKPMVINKLKFGGIMYIEQIYP